MAQGSKRKRKKTHRKTTPHRSVWRSSGRKSRRRKGWSRLRWSWLLLFLPLLLIAYVIYLDIQVRHQFDGKRWSVPARVYARPLELYAGQRLTPDEFAAELASLNYRPVTSPRQPGEVSRNRNVFHLITRPFVHWDGRDESQNVRLTIRGDAVSTLADPGSGKTLKLVRLDPVMVGSFYPTHNEDRVLVKLEEVPSVLTDALIAIEDRSFYAHLGIAPTAILRAIMANIRAGGVVQGGSTLTQQLVKNFFLTSERTFTRKINEAFMALLLELHYDKDEILEAYLNEVYLGQDGSRAVHGFGLASHFYFARPLEELSVEQVALLVALVKGPSYYSPQRYPERALQRRNLVLDVVADLGLITPEAAAQARARGLGTKPRNAAINTFPAFLDLVRRQLQRDYREEDITTEGLRVFTTLDPQVQWRVERVLEARLADLEQRRGMDQDTLEGAAVVTSVQGGEVLALAGSRHPRFAGFNRALDAYRQVGSVIKPFVYLTALEQPERYTLSTLLDDSPLTYTARNGDTWSPNNYDNEFHDIVPLYLALAQSYNVTTARLGLELGIRQVITTLKRIGAEHEFRPYPSLVLGADELSPLQVTRIYQTLASGGFRMPLRAIRAVLAADAALLQSYPLRVKSVIEPGPAYLVTTALQYAMREGTGSSIYQALPPGWEIAGKTGTTDGLRDSWFAGYTGDRLGVVWVGRDDNKPTGLTGSTGALRIWRGVFAGFDAPGLLLPGVEDIEYHWIDPETNLLADEDCPNAVQLPYIRGSAPVESAPCARSGSPLQRPVDWFKELFE